MSTPCKLAVADSRLEHQHGRVAGLDVRDVAEVLEDLHDRAEDHLDRLASLVWLEDHRAAEGGVGREQVIRLSEVLGLGGRAKGVASHAPQPIPPPSAMPVDRTGGQHVRAQRAAENLLDGASTQRRASRGRRRCQSPSPRAWRRGPRWRCCPVAPGGTGQPPSSPNADSKESIAVLHRGEHVRQALATGVVEVRGELGVAELRPSGVEEVADLSRVRHPGGVAEGDLGTSGRLQPPGDLEHPLNRHLALVGATEAGRDHTLAAQPLRQRALDHALEPRERFGDRAVDVLSVVRLRRREEQVDLVEALAPLQRVDRAPSRWESAPSRRRRRASRRRRARPRRRRAAGSRQGARTRSARSACSRLRPASRSAGPSRRSESPRARSESRRAARPREA